MRNNATLFYEKRMKRLVVSFRDWHSSALFLYACSIAILFERIGKNKSFFAVRPLRKDLSWSKVKGLNYICCRECSSLKGEADLIERTHGICSHFVRLVLSVVVSGDSNEFNKAVHSPDESDLLWSMGDACHG